MPNFLCSISFRYIVHFKIETRLSIAQEFNVEYLFDLVILVMLYYVVNVITKLTAENHLTDEHGFNYCTHFLLLFEINFQQLLPSKRPTTAT